MYSIFTYIWAICGVNVGKYSIHGAYGILYKSYDIVIYKLYRLYGLWMFRKHLTSKQLFITIVNGNYKSTNITGGVHIVYFFHMRNIKLDVFEAWLHEKTVFRVTNSETPWGASRTPGNPARAPAKMISAQHQRPMAFWWVAQAPNTRNHRGLGWRLQKYANVKGTNFRNLLAMNCRLEQPCWWENVPTPKEPCFMWQIQ